MNSIFGTEDNTYNDIREKSLMQWLDEMSEHEDIAVRGGVKLAREYVQHLNDEIARLESENELKTQYLGSKNPRLHTDETLIALSVSAASNPEARLALEQLRTLKGCQAHTSVMLSSVDIWEFRKLGIELTCEPKFEKEKKYH